MIGGYRTLAPLPSTPRERGQVGEGNQAHIWKASGAPDVPGPRARLRKSGGELGRPRPPPLAGSAGAGEGPGRTPNLGAFRSWFPSAVLARAAPEEETQLRAGKDRVTTQSPLPLSDGSQRLGAGEMDRGTLTERSVTSISLPSCRPFHPTHNLSFQMCNPALCCTGISQTHDNGITGPIFWREKLRPWIRIQF